MKHRGLRSFVLIVCLFLLHQSCTSSASPEEFHGNNLPGLNAILATFMHPSTTAGRFNRYLQQRGRTSNQVRDEQTTPEILRSGLRKRTLSLFNHWKNLDPLRRTLSLPLYSRQQRKPVLPQLENLADDVIKTNPVPRGSHRSLRPLGLPLRWG